MRIVPARVLTIAVVVLLLSGVSAACDAEGAGLPLRGWNVELRDDHPVETDRRLNGTADGGVSYAQRLANQASYTSESRPVAGYYGPGYSTIIATDSPPVYYVDRSRAHLQPVVWMVDDTPAPASAAAGLAPRFTAVPVPTGPHGERFEEYYHRPLTGGGPDQQLTLYDPRTHEMWEMWQFRWDAAAGRYAMAYGGYSPDVTTEGHALPNHWGARATSIPLHAGIMLQSEYAAGAFEHPLTISIPVVKAGFLAPATREDGRLPASTVGGDARDAVPEGAWFRLPADFPIDSRAPKLLQMMIRAARDYGIVVADGSGGTVTFYAEGANAIGTPYSPLTVPAFPPSTPDGPYYGKNDVLDDFPWGALVQIEFEHDD